MGLSQDDLRALDRLLGEVLDLADDARARWLETLPAAHAQGAGGALASAGAAAAPAF